MHRAIDGGILGCVDASGAASPKLVTWQNAVKGQTLVNYLAPLKLVSCYVAVPPEQMTFIVEFQAGARDAMP